MSQSDRLVQKLWSYCNVLRDDGLSYQDYLEQLTFLLFLKMSDERAKLSGGDEPIPAGYRWSDLSDPNMEGARLEDHYRETLAALGAEGGMLGVDTGGPRLRGPLQCQPAVAGEQSLLGLLYPLPTQYRRCDARQAQHPRRPCPLQPRAYEAPPRARSRPQE